MERRPSSHENTLLTPYRDLQFSNHPRFKTLEAFFIEKKLLQERYRAHFIDPLCELGEQHPEQALYLLQMIKFFYINSVSSDDTDNMGSATRMPISDETRNAYDERIDTAEENKILRCRKMAFEMIFGFEDLFEWEPFIQFGMGDHGDVETKETPLNIYEMFHAKTQLNGDIISKTSFIDVAVKKDTFQQELCQLGFRACELGLYVCPPGMEDELHNKSIMGRGLTVLQLEEFIDLILLRKIILCTYVVQRIPSVTELPEETLNNLLDNYINDIDNTEDEEDTTRQSRLSDLFGCCRKGRRIEPIPLSEYAIETLEERVETSTNHHLAQHNRTFIAP